MILRRFTALLTCLCCSFSRFDHFTGSGKVISHDITALLTSSRCSCVSFGADTSMWHLGCFTGVGKMLINDISCHSVSSSHCSCNRILEFLPLLISQKWHKVTSRPVFHAIWVSLLNRIEIRCLCHHNIPPLLLLLIFLNFIEERELILLFLLCLECTLLLRRCSSTSLRIEGSVGNVSGSGCCAFLMASRTTSPIW